MRRDPNTRTGLPVVFWLLALLLGLWVILRAPFMTDMSVFLPQRPTPEQQLLVQNLTEGVASRLLLVAVDGIESSAQAAFSSALAKQLRGAAVFRSVNNGSLDGLRADQALLFEHRYRLSPAVRADRFEAAALRTALEDAVDLLSSSAGAFAGDLALRDPTGETMRIVDNLTAGQTPRMHDGVWVSSDGARLMLLLYTRALGSDLDGQQAALSQIERDFEQVKVAQAQPRATLNVSGPGKFAVESRRSIQHDVTRLSLIGTLMVLSLLLFAFRSPWAIALAIVPIASAVIAGAASVALVFGSIHGLTMGFGTTLIGESVDYALYHLVRLASASPAPQAAFWRTIRLGVLTSVVGFGALLFTGFPGLAQLAVFSIAGLIVAALVTRWVLPVLTPRSFRPRDLGWLDAKILRALQALHRMRWPVTAALVLVSAIALNGVVLRGQKLWDSDIAALNPISSAAQALHEQLQQELGAPNSDLMIVVNAPSQEQTLAAAHEVSAALDQLVREKVIAGYDSPSALLPPLAVQRERIAALPESSALQALLAQAADGLPIRPERFASFVQDVAKTKASEPLTRADLADTQLGLRLEAQLIGEQAAIILLRPAKGAALAAEQLKPRLPKLADGQVHLLALKAETDKLYGGYLREAAWLSFGGALAIIGLLAGSLRTVKGVAIVSAPLAGAVVAVIALYAGLDRPMNLLHLIGLLLVVAIGSNYALFMHSLRDGELAGARNSGTLASLVLANLTTLAGFSILAVSKVPLLAALGGTVGAGAALALVLSGLWIGPGATPAPQSRIGR